MRRRFTTGVVVGLALTLIAAACGSSKPAASGNNSAPPWKIGTQGPLGAGPFVATFGEVAKGVALFVQYQNDVHGGVLGRKLALYSQDDAGDATKAVQAFSQLNQDGIIVLTGLGVSPTVEAVCPLITTAQLPTLQGPSQSPCSLQNPYMHSMQASSADEADSMTAYMKNLVPAGSTVGYAGIATGQGKIFNESGNSAASKYGFKAAGGNVQLSVTSTDYSSQAQTLASSHPKAIGTLLSANQIVPLWNALQAAGFDGSVIYNSSVQTVSEQINSAKLISATQWAEPTDTSNPGIKRINAELAKMKPPGKIADSYMLWGWVIGQIVADTLTKCGASCDRQSFQQTLTKTGVYTCDAKALCAGWNLAQSNGFEGQRFETWDPTTKTIKSTSDWFK